MKNGLRKVWREYRGLAVFLVLMAIFRSALADWNVVPTGSMKPTIVEGDRILVNKLAYDLKIPLTHISLHRFADPMRGDIVVFDSRAAATRLVKRVIGLPGDTVQMRDNRLTINGIAARYSGIEYEPDATFAIESYLNMSHRIELAPAGASRFSTFGPVTVPRDHYLVLGDNRDNSADSRYYGFIPRDEIVGNAKTIVLSLDYDDYYIPRADRFFRPL
ncbi:MAG TPA: signal peptidase I [Casimicrobiaceae bacterium]|jgi:signal peptidase I|nr:signal peptidase I [Casimicrobiaceae bacterium]